MFLFCKECSKIFEDKNFSEEEPNSTCTHCGAQVEIPTKCCGICVESAELSDGAMICCPRSSQQELNLVPYNADAEGCKLFQNFDELPDFDEEGIAEEDIEGLEDALDDLDEAVEEAEKVSEKASEFDDAFDEVDDESEE